MPTEYLHEATEELKRVDHLVYVSLKYTRTVDVLMNIISRMIDGYDRMFDAMLAQALAQGRIGDVPNAPLMIGNLVRELYPEQVVQDNVELYFLLRKLSRSNPSKEQEFRRHVAMRTVIDGQEQIVNIDIASDYYHKQRDFLEYLYRTFVIMKPERYE